MKNCIMGMFLTYNIPSLFQCTCHSVFIGEYISIPFYREYISRFMVWVQFSISDSDPNPMNYVALYFRYYEGQCFCLIASILGFSVRGVSQPTENIAFRHISVFAYDLRYLADICHHCR